MRAQVVMRMMFAFLRPRVPVPQQRTRFTVFFVRGGLFLVPACALDCAGSVVTTTMAPMTIRQALVERVISSSRLDGARGS